MRLLKQALTVLGTVVVIAIIAALVTPKTAHAVVATAVNVVNIPLPVTTPNSVAIECEPAFPSTTNTCDPNSFFKLNSDGTQQNTAFVIPSGQVFVITDVQWAADSATQLTLLTQPVVSGNAPLLYFGFSTGSGGNPIGSTDHFTTGIVVSQVPKAFANATTANVELIILRGYLLAG
jgi:hypothetical protein